MVQSLCYLKQMAVGHDLKQTARNVCLYWRESQSALQEIIWDNAEFKELKCIAETYSKGNRIKMQSMNCRKAETVTKHVTWLTFRRPQGQLTSGEYFKRAQFHFFKAALEQEASEGTQVVDLVWDLVVSLATAY